MTMWKTAWPFLKDRVILGGPRRVLAATGRVFHLYTDALFWAGWRGPGWCFVRWMRQTAILLLLQSWKWASGRPESRGQERPSFLSSRLFANRRDFPEWSGCGVRWQRSSSEQTCLWPWWGTNWQQDLPANREYTTNILAWYERVPSSANGLCPSLEIDVSVPGVLHMLLQLSLWYVVGE